MNVNNNNFKHVTQKLLNKAPKARNKSPFARDIEVYEDHCERVSERLANSDTANLLNQDPLDYWVSEEHRFETKIAQAIQDILCIPATSTSSERLFSISGQLSSGVKQNINPSNLEKNVIIVVNK